MIDNFKSFGFYHIISILIAIFIGLVFIFLSKKYPDKKKYINIALAISIIIIRSVRYMFDINTGAFSIMDLFSIHVCHINLILLAICLFKPNKNIFTFNFLVGIPTALSVVLMPGSTHQDPGLLRAIFFIMSHTMLIMGAIYLLVNYNFKILKKDLYKYYIISFIGIILVYIFDVVTKANFMYLNKAPKNALLEYFYKFNFPFYQLFIYLVLIGLITLMYYISNIPKKRALS